MTTEEKLVDKIRAILRKADETKNASEAEREVAMRAANRLLLKHGLTMQDVGSLEEQDQRSYVHEHEGYLTTEGDSDAWRGLLLHRLAPIYFCKSYRLVIGRRNRHVLLGRQEHVDACKAMYEFVAPQLQREFDVAVSRMRPEHRLARRYALLAAVALGMDPAAVKKMADDSLAEIGRTRLVAIREAESAEEALRDIMRMCELNSQGTARNVRAFINKGEIAPHLTDNLGVWRRSFFDGAIGKVGGRLKQLMREEVKDLGEPGAALVKNEEASLKAFLDSLDLGLRSTTAHRSVDPHGRESGTAAGARADLSGHRKVGGNRQELNR
jgi:hypothetical protein